MNFTGRILLVVMGLLIAINPLPSQAQEKDEFEIWPIGLPAGAVKIDPEKVKQLKSKEATDEREYKHYVGSPTLTVYPAPQVNSNGCGVVICPGGGYNVLAWRHEGVALARWLNSIGVTAFILKYRVPRRIPNIHWESMWPNSRLALLRK